jgi:hypothetical protein
MYYPFLIIDVTLSGGGGGGSAPIYTMYYSAGEMVVLLLNVILCPGLPIGGAGAGSPPPLNPLVIIIPGIYIY